MDNFVRYNKGVTFLVYFSDTKEWSKCEYRPLNMVDFRNHLWVLIYNGIVLDVNRPRRIPATNGLVKLA